MVIEWLNLLDNIEQFGIRNCMILNKKLYDTIDVGELALWDYFCLQGFFFGTYNVMDMVACLFFGLTM